MSITGANRNTSAPYASPGVWHHLKDVKPWSCLPKLQLSSQLSSHMGYSAPTFPVYLVLAVGNCVVGCAAGIPTCNEARRTLLVLPLFLSHQGLADWMGWCARTCTHTNTHTHQLSYGQENIVSSPAWKTKAA